MHKAFGASQTSRSGLIHPMPALALCSEIIKSAVCLIKRAIFENINFRAARCRWLSVGCWLSVGEPVHQGHHPAFSVRHWIGDVDESQPASHSNLQASDFVDFESVGIPILFVEHLVSVK